MKNLLNYKKFSKDSQDDVTFYNDDHSNNIISTLYNLFNSLFTNKDLLYKFGKLKLSKNSKVSVTIQNKVIKLSILSYNDEELYRIYLDRHYMTLSVIEYDNDKRNVILNDIDINDNEISDLMYMISDEF